MNRLLITALGLLLATACIATADSGSSWGFTGDTRAIMATETYALDSYDRYDLIAFTSAWRAGVYHVSGQDGWDGGTGFYMYDRRAPLQPRQTKTWMLYIWAMPGTSPADFGCAWFQYVDPSVAARMELVQKPSGITGGPALGTVWTQAPGLMTLPFYSTSDGLTGYAFKFSLTAIPEPSSLLALLAGLGGLGVMLRRRRGG